MADSPSIEEEIGKGGFSFSLSKKKLKKKKIEKVKLPPFDIIGDIAIFELPKEFKGKSEIEKEKIS
ncbi:MAG: hypothetical protein NZ903_02060, partial [Candidatus Micrarchaeota archaeon]|nr:hypothetical protein [Candidatus Micrarchaeota archaeon]